MKPVYKVHLLLLFLSGMLSGTIGAQNLNLLWSRVEFGTNLGLSNLQCQDIDGDGQQELVFNGGEYPGQHVFVANYVGNDLRTKWASPMYVNTVISAVLLANPDQDADTEIYVLLQDGTLEVYDGITRQLIDTHQTNFAGAQAAAIADFDSDGHAEIAMVAEYKLVVYDLVSRQTDWENTSVLGTRMTTGDVDGDGVIEIIVSTYLWGSGTGTVVNGKTGAIEWSYLGSFGSALGVADTNGDDIPEIIGIGSGFVTIYDGALHSPLSQFSPSQDLAALLVVDLEGDGHDEIITGDGQWGKIRCYSAETRQLLWEMSNPDHGVTNITTGDPDGDGVPEVVWGSGATSSGADRLYFFDMTTLQEEYQSTDLDGPFYLDAADLNGDETTEFLVTSSASNSNYNGGHVLSYNSNSLALEWDQELFNPTTIHKMILTQARNEQQFEIVTGYYSLTIKDAISFQTLFEVGLGNIKGFKQADLDNDGTQEIIAADESGYITVIGYDGVNFIQKWQSISFYGITALEIANCDADPALEIIFSRNNGIIQAIDGNTKLLQWQFQAPPNSSAQLAVDDLNGDGIMELVYAEGTSLHLYNCLNQQWMADYYDIVPTTIMAIEIAGIDSTSRKEILLVDSRLKIVDSESFQVTWESPVISANSWNVSLIVKDVFDDQHLDVLVGTNAGVYQFGTASTIPDVVAPRVLTHFPARDAELAGINTLIKVNLTERLDPALLDATHVVVQDAAGNVLPVQLTFDTLLFQLLCQPIAFLPAFDTITVTLQGSLADPAQNTLDGNSNGVSEGSPSDDYVWSFTTGSGIDDVGPVTISAQVVPAECWPGVPVELLATFSDYSTVATSGIAFAEFFIDQPGVSGQGIALKPADENWGGIEEITSGKFATDGFSGGNHTLFVHALDLNGNWGVMLETNLHILDESSANWPMYGQNAQHTNDNAYCDLEPPLRLKWTKTYPNHQLKPVTYANGYLLAPMFAYGSPPNSTLYCLDTITGDNIWSYDFGSVFSINPAAYSYGRVYIQTCNNTPGTFLSSFNLQTGDLLWKKPFDAQWETYLSPTIADGKVFINGGTFGGIYGFNAFTGQRLWEKPLLQFHGWTPAYFNGIAYAFAGGALTAHNAGNGQLLWQKDLAFDWAGYTMNTAPVIDTVNRQVFTTSGNYLHAVHLDTHDTGWSISSGLGVTPALSGGKLYVIHGGKLEARNALTGTLSWTFDGDGLLSYPPAVAGEYVFVSSENHLYAVRRSTGQKEWEFNGGGAITLADNLLFLTSFDEKLRAFEHGLTSGAQEVESGISGFTLWPNPVVNQIKINYETRETGNVFIQISDLSGKIVATLLNEELPAGVHTLNWSAEGLPGGMYTCHLQTGSIQAVRKLVVIGRQP